MILSQSSCIWCSQSLPNNAGPCVFTTYNVKSLTWLLCSTRTSSLPSGVIFSPEKVFKIAVVSTRGVFGKVSLYVSKGSVDIAEPVSSSIFSVWPLTFGFTQMTSPTTPWLTLLTSRDATKLSSSRSSST